VARESRLRLLPLPRRSGESRQSGTVSGEAAPAVAACDSSPQPETASELGPAGPILRSLATPPLRTPSFPARAV
jgi:hypothetical protein